MTPEQMATLVPEPKLAAWLLAKAALPVWTIRDAMPSDSRKARLVQQWVIGDRRLYIVLYVQPDKPAVWAIAPELGVVGNVPAAFAAMDRELAHDVGASAPVAEPVHRGDFTADELEMLHAAVAGVLHMTTTGEVSGWSASNIDRWRALYARIEGMLANPGKEP